MNDGSAEVVRIEHTQPRFQTCALPAQYRKASSYNAASSGESLRLKAAEGAEAVADAPLRTLRQKD